MGAGDTIITANAELKVLLTQFCLIELFSYENNRSAFHQNFRILNSPQRQFYFLIAIRNRNQTHYWTGPKSYCIINLILLSHLCYLLMFIPPIWCRHSNLGYEQRIHKSRQGKQASQQYLCALLSWALDLRIHFHGPMFAFSYIKSFSLYPARALCSLKCLFTNTTDHH